MITLNDIITHPNKPKWVRVQGAKAKSDWVYIPHYQVDNGVMCSYTSYRPGDRNGKAIWVVKPLTWKCKVVWPDEFVEIINSEERSSND